MPYKIISDTGGAFRQDFIEQLQQMGVDHHPSSAYNSRNNSLTERGVLQLSELTFVINSHVQHDECGSNNNRFLDRSVRSGLPNFSLGLDHEI